MIFTVIYNMIVFSPQRALSYFYNSLITDGLLLFIVILRASRFRIFKQKYFNINIELPFYYTLNNDEDFKFLWFIPMKIRGEGVFEYKLTTFLDKVIEIYPLDPNSSVVKEPVKVTLLEKLLLKEDVVVYKAIYNNEVYFIKPKTRGETETEDDHPISGLFTLKPDVNYENPSEISYKDLLFMEWIYTK